MTSTHDYDTRYAEVKRRAEAVFSSQEKARRWLSERALGLGRRRPVDLLVSSEGYEQVLDFLTRIEFGVYQ